MTFDRIGLLALLWCAGAGPAFAKPPAPAPMPAPGLAEAEACKRVAVENFQIHTGFAEHAEKSVAIASARRDARRQAIVALCSGKSEARCAVLKRHINPWRDPYFNPETGAACAHVGVRTSYVDDDRGEQAALEKDVAALASAILAKAGGRLALAPPLWTQSGCIAGQAGTSVLSALRNALAAKAAVELVSDPAATAVVISLDPQPGTVVLTAALRQSSGAETLLPGFSFPEDLFDEGDTRGTCRFDSDLGLVQGRRRGPDGRLATLDVGGARFCEGDIIKPVLRVNQPSVVKVFSVARNGRPTWCGHRPDRMERWSPSCCSIPCCCSPTMVETRNCSPWP